MSDVLPTSWVFGDIASLGSVVTGSTPPTTVEDYWNGVIPFISPSDFDGSIVIKKTQRYVTELGASKARVIPPRSILVTCIGSIGAMAVNEVESVTNQQINAVIVNECHSSEFHYYNILNNTDKILNGAGITTLPIINKTTFEKIKIPFPPLPEQKKIAAILSSVDTVIEKTQAQIDKLNDLKTAMMQELLTKGVGDEHGNPHTEFKNSPVGRIPVGWEIFPLNKLIAEINSGWSPDCSGEPKRHDWSVLKTTAVQWSGFKQHEKKYLPLSLDPRPENLINNDDILITRAGPADRVGVVSIVTNIEAGTMLSDKIIRIRTNNSINCRFLYLFLTSDYVRQYFDIRKTGLAESQKNISQEIIKGLHVPVPHEYEQNKISKLYIALEELIDTKNTKLTSLIKNKKALMQDLLTGKVRVKVGA